MQGEAQHAVSRGAQFGDRQTGEVPCSRQTSQQEDPSERRRILNVDLLGQWRPERDARVPLFGLARLRPRQDEAEVVKVGLFVHVDELGAEQSLTRAPLRLQLRVVHVFLGVNPCPLQHRAV